jgi:LysR family transcriptional regulator, regulator for bpeEF and oprC
MNVNAKLNLVLAMQVFARVVEAGTFTKAADSLKMPKATVTKLVQGLENHLRVKLLNRTTRRVTVTPDGSAYYERAVRLLGDLEDIESSVSNAQANPKGRLRIDVGGSLASRFLIPKMPAFVERYPEIQVELGVSDRPIDLLSENVDCVIRGGPLTEQALVTRHVGDSLWVTCATPAYLARYGTPTHPSELESGHVIAGHLSARTGRPSPLVFEREGKRIEIEGRHRVAVNESNAHLAAARAGLGIAQMPAFMLQEVAKGELKAVLAAWQPAPLPVHVLYPPNRHLSAKVRAFVDWAAALFETSALMRRR